MEKLEEDGLRIDHLEVRISPWYYSDILGEPNPVMKLEVVVDFNGRKRVNWMAVHKIDDMMSNFDYLFATAKRTIEEMLADERNRQQGV